MRFVPYLLVATLAACGGVTSPVEPDAGGDDDVVAPDAAPDALAAPVVSGEASAGHARPTWTWTTPDGAAGFRHRIDGGDWTIVDVGTTRFTATADLAAGAHTFEVEAADDAARHGETGAFTTTIEYFTHPGYWNGVARDLHVTPYGRHVAVSCHNCYVQGADPAASLAATLDRVHAAQTAGADTIELDVKVEGGAWHLDHEDDGVATGALLADVLADAALRAGDQVLLIEIKETAPTLGDARALIDLLVDAGWAVNGRPVLFHGFEAVQAGLELVRTVANADDYPFHHPYLRYHLIVGGTGTPGTFHAKLETLAGNGWHGVGLEHTSRNLFGAIAYAEELGLGVAVWTITWDAQCAAFRDEVDMITTDFSVAACGAIVEEANGLVRLDTTAQEAGAGAVVYQGANAATSFTRAATGVGPEPALLSDAPGEDRFGTTIDFNAAELDALALHDADNGTADGYLVSVVANFDTILIAEGATASLLAKSDTGGFTLELYHPVGNPTTVLRFGVYVSGTYHYATYDVSALDGSDSYHIVGGYDGNGAVRIFVNGVQGTPSAALTGGVAQNASPIVVAADPQGATATRFHWDGLIQTAVVQNWTDH